MSTLTGDRHCGDRCTRDRFSGSSEDPLNRSQITLPLTPIRHRNEKRKLIRSDHSPYNVHDNQVMTAACGSVYDSKVPCFLVSAALSRASVYDQGSVFVPGTV
ncbi:hypothetical protein UY3_07813 [Chelonia mydas]|uniref:Uncharacterized protein n=1 Tax=Chelonia mydas TaxID=8469 RepID=M7BHA7_CHEMY|nr:hypothetical protein UY3_07813 [Chelonia mydas]